MVLSTTGDGRSLTTAVRNNFEEDAYFLTTLVSNGVCPAWCPDTWPSKFPDPKVCCARVLSFQRSLPSRTNATLLILDMID
jgi:hypothetical protein